MVLNKIRPKHVVTVLWVFLFLLSLYVYFFNKDFLESKFLGFFGSSLILAYLVYLVGSCLRGFTLIPVTYFILIGLVLFSPWPLYIMTMIGVLVSSVCVYYFSEYLNFDEYFEKKYPQKISQIKEFLAKNELLIVILWSSAPFLPTDLICYVCGTLDMNIRKFILGVLIGEGVMCFIYIFLGKELLGVIGF